MKKRCKRWILLWMVLTLVVTSIQPFSFKEVFAATKKEIYSDATCKIFYQTMSEWETGFEGQISIENTGTKPIENWKLQFTFNQDIKSIWDGEIASHKGNTYVLKYPSWNSKIPVGGKAVIGFNGTKKGKIETPKDCKILLDKGEVSQDDYTINYRTTSDWKDGFNGEIAITNNTNKSIEGWQLEFDFAATIQNFWTAKLISHEGNHYVIKNDDWNSVIQPKQTITLGFGGSPGNISTKPENFKLIAAREDAPKEEESVLTKQEEEKIKKTNEYLEETEKILSDIDYKDLAVTVKQLKKQEGVSEVKQDGNYLDIVYKTGIKQSVIASDETNLSKQLRGGGTEDKAEDLEGTEDKVEDLEGTEDKVEDIVKKDSGSYFNQNLIDLREKYANYQEDDTCTELKNRKILLWIPMDTKWGEYDEVKIMKQVVKAEDNLDIELNIVSDEKATANVLKNLDEYGMVIFASHGHNAEWLMTGETYKADMTSETKKALLNEEERIITLVNKKGVDDYYGVTPKWFDKNVKNNMPGTIVYNNSCGSIKTDAMWDVFKSKGASTYLGYDGNVRNEFAIMNLTLFFASFIDERQSVFNSTSFMVDKYYSKEGTSFVPVGQGNYKIARDFDVSGVKQVLFPIQQAPKVIGKKSKIYTNATNRGAVTDSQIVTASVELLVGAIGAVAFKILIGIILSVAVVIVAHKVHESLELWGKIQKKIKEKSAKVLKRLKQEVATLNTKNEYANSAHDERDDIGICVIESVKKDEKPQIVKVNISYKYYRQKKGKFAFTVSVAPFTENPVEVNLKVIISRADTKNGVYIPKGYKTLENIKFNTPYDILCERGTGHYKVSFQLTCPRLTYTIKPLNNKQLQKYLGKDYFCLNRTGHLWNYNTDAKDPETNKLTGTIMREPPSNYEKMDFREYRLARDENQRAVYVEEYNRRHGTKYTQSYFSKKGYDIHHMRPVRYGGPTTFENLIHLNKFTHVLVTSWFRGY